MKDLNSQNGTFVGNRRVTVERLSDGDAGAAVRREVLAGVDASWTELTPGVAVGGAIAERL